MSDDRCLMIFRILPLQQYHKNRPIIQYSHLKITMSNKPNQKTIVKRKRNHIKLEYHTSDSPPDHWKETLDLIESQRKLQIAPVDTMGCESLTEKDLYPPEVSRYHCLTSLMLSSLTKDEMTAEAMRNLKNHGLTIGNILNTEESKIDELIKKVGFHQRKAGYIKKVAKILNEEYHNDIPESYDDVIKLPGVGPKMAHILMNIAWDKPVGIGVDVHVHRISNRLGWVKSDTPEQTRVQLEKWLPKEYWSSINKTLVGFGQTICKAKSPNCEGCFVKDLCPSSLATSPSKKKKK